MTAIHLAAKNGHVTVLDALKGKVSWKAPSVKTGLTALHIAAHYGQSDFVREMLTKVPATVRSESPASMPGDLKEISVHDVRFHFKSKFLNLFFVRVTINSH